MNQRYELKEIIVFYGLMWFISLPTAVLCGETIALIVYDAIDRITPWQGIWQSLSVLEMLRLFLCGIILLHGAIWGLKGLFLDLQGRGILSLMTAQQNRTNL
ncbi:MAG: hypothetical protein P8171_26035 [Candidatus Thiodiazotropha sp.]